jgi:hypothetical protein
VQISKQTETANLIHAQAYVYTLNLLFRSREIMKFKYEIGGEQANLTVQEFISVVKEKKVTEIELLY